MTQIDIDKKFNHFEDYINDLYYAQEDGPPDDVEEAIIHAKSSLLKLRNIIFYCRHTSEKIFNGDQESSEKYDRELYNPARNAFENLKVYLEKKELNESYINSMYILEAVILRMRKDLSSYLEGKGILDDIFK